MFRRWSLGRRLTEQTELGEGCEAYLRHAKMLNCNCYKCFAPMEQPISSLKEMSTPSPKNKKATCFKTDSSRNI
jgi:hypothetical protein